MILLLKRPTATCNLFVLHNDQKTKKADTHTCPVPHNYSKICAFQSQTLFFVSAFLFSFNLLEYSCFETFSMVFSCPKQINGENILQNIASLFFSFSRVLRHHKYSRQSESTSIFLHKWRHVPCVMTSSNIPSLSILNI